MCSAHSNELPRRVPVASVYTRGLSQQACFRKADSLNREALYRLGMTVTRQTLQDHSCLVDTTCLRAREVLTSCHTVSRPSCAEAVSCCTVLQTLLLYALQRDRLCSFVLRYHPIMQSFSSRVPAAQIVRVIASLHCQLSAPSKLSFSRSAIRFTCWCMPCHH